MTMTIEKSQGSIVTSTTFEMYGVFKTIILQSILYRVF